MEYIVGKFFYFLNLKVIPDSFAKLFIYFLSVFNYKMKWNKVNLVQYSTVQ